jgi:hypothetical protein
MKRKISPSQDPVVEEVRKIRAELWGQAGRTVPGLIRLLDELQLPVGRTAIKKGKAAGRRSRPS